MHGLTADGSEGDGQWSGARPHWLHTQSARAACRGAHAQGGRLPPPMYTGAGGILLRGMHGLCESERGEVRLVGLARTTTADGQHMLWMLCVFL